MSQWGWAEWALAALAVIGVLVSFAFGIWGIWARKNPQKARLRVEIESARIGLPHDQRVQVTLDGTQIETPYLSTITIQHVAGEEIETFPETGLVIEDQGSPESVLAMLGDSASSATWDENAAQIVVHPRVFKTGETLTLTALSSSNPTLVAQGHIAKVDIVTSDDGRETKGAWLQAGVTALSLIVAGFAMVAAGLRPDEPDMSGAALEQTGLNDILIVMGMMLLTGVAALTAAGVVYRGSRKSK